MTTKRRRRAHRRRAIQSARDARKRTGRKVLDLRNPCSRRIAGRLSPASLKRQHDAALVSMAASLGGRGTYPFGPLIDELLR